MQRKKREPTLFVLCIAFLLNAVTLRAAEQSSEELAKAAQNPVASLISVPFQNNLNFNVGPQNSPQNILNIQPVIPLSLGPKWNLITRTIMPVISQPAFGPGQDSQFGLGDIQFSAFLSPAKPGKIIWGIGAISQIPSHTDDRLGIAVWGLGPTAVALRSRGNWVYGALINNVLSLNSGGDRVFNNFLLQPFLNYNFGETGTYLSSAPIITANWKTGDWVVPLGCGIGQIFKIFGKQPVNASLQAFYNIAHPDNLGPEWTLRFQIQFLFPQ